MNTVKPQLKNLSPLMIDTSLDIQEWLSQFHESQRTTAKLLLSRLQFVSRDVYSAWLREVVEKLPSGKIFMRFTQFVN